MPNDQLPDLVAFEWDESKRERNLAKHGIDFEDAVLALSTPRFEYPSPREDEDRTIAICRDSERLIAVIYTMRGSVCRIISVRAARDNERREYHARYPG